MDRTTVQIFAGAALLMTLLLSAQLSASPQSIWRAQELFEEANYEEALKVADRLIADQAPPAERQAAREYRVMCLLALRRTPEAEKAIEEMIEADPFYSPAADVRPRRFLAEYDRIRRQHLPVLVAERYRKAKADFDNQRYTTAADGFAQVLNLIAVAASVEGSPDDRFATIGNATTAHLNTIKLAREPKPPPGEITYSSADASVTPPIPIHENIPWWSPPRSESVRLDGELEIVVDTAGNVRATRVTTSIHPAYDQIVLEAAKKWKYRPARKNGRPVPYRLSMSISLASRR